MLQINWDDVVNVFMLCLPYLIGFSVVLLLAIIITFIAKKLTRSKKYMVRAQAWIATTIALVVTVNLIMWGPLATLVTLATGKGTIEDNTIEEAEELSETIVGEGIVLLENEEELLPLSNDNSTMNLFGWSSTNPIYGGSGSGALSDLFPFVDIADALENSGIETNSELFEFYTDYQDKRPEVELFEQDWTLPEPLVTDYSDELIENAREFSDIAMIVISRTGAEGVDLPLDVSQVTYENNSEDYEDFKEGDHYLQLSQSERNMVEMVTENFEDVILVYNSASAFELDFVEEFDEIKSVLWVPGTGHNGFNALGEVIKGEINPSGKTVDTFLYDLENTPSFNNFGDFEYTNMDEFVVESEFTDGVPTFVNYIEGIYVGYRFFETAAAENLIEYDEIVQYPFGYGLSYTTFEQKIDKLNVENDGQVVVEVTVTNTGDTAGKEVVEIYYTPPYINGGIEKSEVNLVDFEKTQVIESGESETVTITFNEEDLASFDTYGEGAWILEAGDYQISLRTDSHNIVDQETISIDETIVYDADNARSTDDVAATPLLDFAEGDIDYLSRSNGFENYETVTAAPSNFEMPKESKEGFYNDTNYDPIDFEDPDAEMPIVDADNGLELIEMRGLEYEDEAWEPLLDQLTIDEMVDMIALGGYQTAEAPSVGKVQTVDLDGPAAINNNFTDVGSVGMPTATMLGNTFNKELSKEFGTIMAMMAADMDITGWYAPGINLHRTAFGGRNFEYYSEDGLLTGKISANIVKGAMEQGVYSYIKHFALNDQEENRWRMLNTWATEQSIRENYLKPFELAVKEGDTTAVMSAYNYIGNEWAGSSDALLNKILRDEWGFRGMVITDYFAGFSYMDADRAIRGGGDFSLIPYDNHGNFLDDTTSATAVSKMRTATKNILYATVNSRTYEEGNYNSGMHSWQIVSIFVNVILLILIVGLEVLVFRKYKKINIEIKSLENKIKLG